MPFFSRRKQKEEDRASPTTPGPPSASDAGPLLDQALPRSDEVDEGIVPAAHPCEKLRRWLSSTVHSREEALKLGVIASFCFTANTILLLGRNIGATMVLSALGASAMPWCMIVVGGAVFVASPLFSRLSAHYSPTSIMAGLTFGTLCLFLSFAALFYSGLAARFPYAVYPAFFTCEEVLVTLQILTFWQIAMLSFSPHEAKRLIGIVNLGASLANIANGFIVGLVLKFSPRGAKDIIVFQCMLLAVQLLPNAAAASYMPASSSSSSSSSKGSSSEAKKAETTSADAEQPAEWWNHPIVRLTSFWAAAITLLFSCIEFQYNAVLAITEDAEGIAQITANLASFAGVGQAAVNLFLTPTLLQMPPRRGLSGVGFALLVTPIAYAVGEVIILCRQSVATVFAARLLDFLFRYTINDSR